MCYSLKPLRFFFFFLVSVFSAVAMGRPPSISISLPSVGPRGSRSTALAATSCRPCADVLASPALRPAENKKGPAGALSSPRRTGEHLLLHFVHEALGDEHHNDEHDDGHNDPNGLHGNFETEQ